MITSTPIPGDINANDTPAPPVTNTGTSDPAVAPTASQEPALTTTEAAPIDGSPVATLKAMFPDYDDIVLQSILESVNYDQDRAIDTLLGMSDPNYKPATPDVTHSNTSGHVSQADLDEQMARQLYMEDQRQYEAAQQARTAQRQGPRHSGWGEGPHPSGAQSPGEEKDTMAEITQQVNKFAETGKKTFQSLFSQAKAKVQEFQNSQNRTPSGESDQYIYQGSSGQGSSLQQPAPRPDQSAGYTPPPPQVQPYDTAPPPTSTAPAPAPQVDGSKIGMLPKRPVSLLRPNSDTSTAPADGAPGHPQPIVTERENSLEYVENPFEDENSKRR